MRVKIVNLLFLCCLFSAVLSWGQYSTTSQPILQDITSYLPTVNAWHSFPGQCEPWTITIGTGALMGCISPNDGNVYTSTPGGSWVKQTWGQPSTVKIGDSNNVYALVSDPAHCSTGYSVDKLVNGSFTTQPAGGCLSQMEVAQQDFTLVGVNAGIGYELLPGTTTWLSLGSGLNWVSASSQNLICGVTASNVLETYSSGSWHAVSPAPPFTPNACSYATGGQLFTWNRTSGVAIYSGSAWTVISGEVVSSMAVLSKGLAIATNSTGSLFHLNLLAGGIKTLLSGTGPTSCGGACPPNTIHTGNVQVTIANGLNGQDEVGTADAHHTINVASTDFAPGCDFLFGSQPSDPACSPVYTSSVHCPILGRDTYNKNGGGGVGCNIPTDFTAWPGAQTITVYFDGNYYPSVALPCQTSNAACDIWMGIASWNNGTIELNQYVLGGTIAPANVCNLSGLNYPVPCSGVHYPFIFVTDLAKLGGRCQDVTTAGCNTLPIHWNFQGNPSGGLQWFDEMAFDGTYYKNPGQFAAKLQYLGAHEEGHNNALGDCYANNPNCNQSATTTVMWELDVTNIDVPQPCDVIMSNFWQSGLKGIPAP